MPFNRFFLNVQYLFSVERNPGECCNEIEVVWSPNVITMASTLVSSPNGKYTLQAFKTHDKAVYYNNENKCYIYNDGNEWVVSI